MNPNEMSIFYPVFAQVALVFTVWIYLYVGRLGSIYKNKVKVQSLADAKIEEAIFAPAQNASDNFENQFEMPLLFYLAAILIYITHSIDTTYLWMSSLFVFFRVVHSIIHCTYNEILHRFLAYAFSSILLWALWIRLGVHLIF